MNNPLADRVRPESLADVVGHSHLLGKNGVITRLLEQKSDLPAIILWGYSGVGKTTIANLIAKEIGVHIYPISAINHRVMNIRQISDEVNNSQLSSRPILFIDELHHFSKRQQDSLLEIVEKGKVTFIGATTENPSFEVIAPLLSRSVIYRLERLNSEELLKIAKRAILTDKFLSKRSIVIKESLALLNYADGDGRKLLNVLELVCNTHKVEHLLITDELVANVAINSTLKHDKKGDLHYNLISAFIKSVRGSDPNAAIYYLARMLEAGEDPLFIARRLIILASEDVGNANPQAIIVATSTFQAVNSIGMPEARIVLAQCTIFLACCPKSNASFQAIESATSEVRKSGTLEIPMQILNAPTRLMKDMGYGEGYKYAHSYNESHANMEFLPRELSGTKFYEPKNNRWESAMRKYLKACWKDKYNY